MDILIGAHEAALAAAYAKVNDLQAVVDALRRQLQERDAAQRNLRAELESLRTENAELRRRLQACDNVNRLITEAARGDFSMLTRGS
jgi:cell division protein FtsB